MKCPNKFHVSFRGSEAKKKESSSQGVTFPRNTTLFGKIDSEFIYKPFIE
jgi:hypothetical protein